MPLGQGSIFDDGNAMYANKPFGMLHPPPPYIMEDFLVDVLADDPYVTVAQSGTPITAAAIDGTAGDPVAGMGGWLAGSTDDVDAEIDEVAVGGLGTGAGTPWLRADQLGTGIMVCEWGITIPAALTTRQYFAGLSDDPTEGTGTNGPLNIQTGTTIVATATDAAGWIFSSKATNPTKWKYGAADSGSADTATDGPTATANTWIGLRVEVDVNGDCTFYTRAVRNGPLTLQGTSVNGVSPDVLLVPVFTAAPTTTTTVPWEIDYCFAAACPVSP